MSPRVINKVLLPENACFGCGHDNAMGLKIEVYRDPEDENRLIGRLHPRDHMIGFPGMTHGGVIYTALDCLASWTPTLLRSEMKAAWVLRSAEMKYLRPAHIGNTLLISAYIAKETKMWRPIVVQAEARDQKENLLTVGHFKLVPLTSEKLKAVAGINHLPENWRRLLDNGVD